MVKELVEFVIKYRKMGLFEKSDLKFSYSWEVTPGDNPKTTGQPDSTLFNRNEGYEVLYLINRFAEIYDLCKKTSGHKIEKLIRMYLPSECISQEHVCEWIFAHWEKYP